MSVQYHIRHETSYAYVEPVEQCYNVVHLTPRTTLRQAALNTRLEVAPLPSHRTSRTDYFGNEALHFTVTQPHDALRIVVESDVRMDTDQHSLPFDASVTCGYVLRRLRDAPSAETLAALEFLYDSPHVKRHPDLGDYAADCFAEDRPLIAAVLELTARIHEDFAYDPGYTTVSTPVLEVFEHKRGVCQDFAHFAIAVLRTLGFPARYVSGYLETLPPPGREKLRGADATHAWFSVFAPGEGWVDFDPTNNVQVGEQHITTAWGRDYADVSPVQGIIFGGGPDHDVAVSVDVTRIEDH